MRFFAVPALEPGEAEGELNAFLAAHRVVHVERRLVEAPGGAYWAIALDTDGGASPADSKKGRVDYKEVLSPDDFALFAELRTLRKEMANAEGVPPYTLFNNEQLAAIVTRRATTKSALGEIYGIGPARVEKYGDAFCERLATLLERRSAGPGPRQEPEA